MSLRYTPMEGIGGWFLGCNEASTDFEAIRRQKDGSTQYYVDRDAAVAAEELFQNPLPEASLTKKKRSS